ncbi:hypothetical protein PINS_up002557 [Pythium insidiosum]|nr:hypothetical protein PINS_up002557 [Pythium insidiosum]
MSSDSTHQGRERDNTRLCVAPPADAFVDVQSFYDEAKAQRIEIETLKATIYEQEQHRRLLEARALEREQCVAVLTRYINELPELRLQNDAIQSTTTTETERTCTSDVESQRERILRLVVAKFDANEDEKLDGDELVTFKTALSDSNPQVYEELASTTVVDASTLRTIYKRQGDAQFEADCHALGIHFGAKRATTRLREGFAEVRVALDGKDNEIRRIEQHRSHVDSELQATKDQVFTLSSDLKKALSDLAAATTAVHDLRALVEDQVTEKEKWQRYCWELEERLFDAIHSSKAKERVLWKTLDAKKEETRKNMLLYMESQRGKRHWVFPRDAKATNTESTNQFLWGDVADGDESDQCSTVASDCAIEQSNA